MSLPPREIIFFVLIVNYQLHCIVIEALRDRCERPLHRARLELFALKHLHRVFGEWVHVGDLAVWTVDEEVAVHWKDSKTFWIANDLRGGTRR